MDKYSGRAKLDDTSASKENPKKAKGKVKAKPKAERVRVFYKKDENSDEKNFLLAPDAWPYDLKLARDGCEVYVFVDKGQVKKAVPKGLKLKYVPEKAKGSGLRGATANYNFVDYDKEHVIDATDESSELYSGKIVCSLSTMPNSPLLVAGPSNKNTKNSNAKDREFLKVDNSPVISGSSLKGMIRSLVEVMSYSSVHHVSDDSIFFREITAKGGEGKGASYYKSFIGSKANAGFVKMDGPNWILTEASVELIENESDFKIKPKHHKFHSVGFIVAPRDKKGKPLKDKNGKPLKIYKFYDFGEIDGGKEHILSDKVVKDFKKQLELSKAQKNFWEDNKYEDMLTKDPLGVPFFYATKANDPNEITAIGLVRYFRIPYELTPNEVAGGVLYNDFSSKLFGFADKNIKSKGKVSIGSLVFKEGSYKNYDAFDAALLAPHPSCLAHYLKQESNSIKLESNDSKNKVESLAHYLNIDAPKIRGRKFYWHRSFQKQSLDDLNGNKEILSKLHPIVDASGDFEITVDKVSKEELGAIIMAIQLPEGCAHKLGSGKSLGMGSVRIDIKQFDVQEISQKYQSIEDRFNSFNPQPSESKFDTTVLNEYTDCFKCYVLEKLLKEPADDPSYYFEQKEVNNLFKMLDYKNRPSNEKTRNMDLDGYKSKRILNNIDEIYGNKSPFDK